MKSFNEALIAIENNSIAEEFKKRVDKILQSWDSSLIYPKELINKLFMQFYAGTEFIYVCKESKSAKHDINYESVSSSNSDDDSSSSSGSSNKKKGRKSPPSFNRSLTPPLLPKSLSTETPLRTTTVHEPDEDVDGVPIDLNECYGKSIDQLFTSSKWETIDPEEVEAQAVTTSKWAVFDNQSEQQQREQDEKNKKLSESQRKQLREIEIKTMQYQDELESGTRSLRRGNTISGQVEDYRQKLMRKMVK